MENLIGRETTIMLDLRAVMKRTSISRSTIYRKLNPKEKLYDETFPRPIKIGSTMNRWLESEIEQWLLNQISLNRR